MGRTALGKVLLRWHADFKTYEESDITAKPCLGKPRTATTDKNEEEINIIILNDRRLTNLYLGYMEQCR